MILLEAGRAAQGCLPPAGISRSFCPYRRVLRAVSRRDQPASRSEAHRQGHASSSRYFCGGALCGELLCGELLGGADGCGVWPCPPCCWSRILCWIAASFCSCSGVRIALIFGLPSCRICRTFCCFWSIDSDVSFRTAVICLFSSSTTSAIFCFWSGVSWSSSSTDFCPLWPEFAEPALDPWLVEGEGLCAPGALCVPELLLDGAGVLGG